MKWDFPILRMITRKEEITWSWPFVLKFILIGWTLKILLFNIIGVYMFNMTPFPIIETLIGLLS